MREEVRERRIFMMQEYVRSLSERHAIDATAEKFGVNRETLYVDWSRQNSWLKEIVNLKDNTHHIRQIFLEICRTLQEIQELASNADNDNCRLGAHKLKINTLFKLIDFLKTTDIEELRERVEKLEKKTEKGVFIP